MIIGSLIAVSQLGWISIPGLSYGKKMEPSKIVAEEKEIGPTVKLSPMIINLKEEGGRNYLKVIIILEITKKDWLEEVKSKTTPLTDIAILTLSDKRMEELKASDSKEKLKQELLTKMNQYFQTQKIKRIYFDEFLYQ